MNEKGTQKQAISERTENGTQGMDSQRYIVSLDIHVQYITIGVDKSRQNLLINAAKSLTEWSRDVWG